MNWRDVPIPARMQALPRDPRGFPIPHIVLRDQAGAPVFKANDSAVVHACRVHRLCGVCGGKLVYQNGWVLGGPQSAFHPRGAYVDSPIHHECGVYALQVCPYLALSTYRGVDPVKTAEQLDERFGGTALFIDQTQDPSRVPLFVLARVRSWTFSLSGSTIPERPFMAIEYWKDGNRLDEEAAQALLKEVVYAT
jgi:hypothetical protein